MSLRRCVFSFYVLSFGDLARLGAKSRPYQRSKGGQKLGKHVSYLNAGELGAGGKVGVSSGVAWCGNEAQRRIEQCDKKRRSLLYSSKIGIQDAFFALVL